MRIVDKVLARVTELPFPPAAGIILEPVFYDRVGTSEIASITAQAPWFTSRLKDRQLILYGQARVRDESEAGARKNQPAQSSATGAAKQVSLWQNGDFGFADSIDVINPLQLIPIVATISRNLSGDHIGMGARGIGGLVAGTINTVIEWFNGNDRRAACSNRATAKNEPL